MNDYRGSVHNGTRDPPGALSVTPYGYPPDRDSSLGPGPVTRRD